MLFSRQPGWKETLLFLFPIHPLWISFSLSLYLFSHTNVLCYGFFLTYSFFPLHAVLHILSLSFFFISRFLFYFFFCFLLLTKNLFLCKYFSYPFFRNVVIFLAIISQRAFLLSNALIKDIFIFDASFSFIIRKRKCAH